MIAKEIDETERLKMDKYLFEQPEIVAMPRSEIATAGAAPVPKADQWAAPVPKERAADVNKSTMPPDSKAQVPTDGKQGGWVSRDGGTVDAEHVVRAACKTGG